MTQLWRLLLALTTALLLGGGQPGCVSGLIHDEGGEGDVEIHLTLSYYGPDKYHTHDHSLHKRETFFAIVANCLNEAFSVVHIVYENADCHTLFKQLAYHTHRAKGHMGGAFKGEDVDVDSGTYIHTPAHSNLPKVKCYPYDHQPTYFDMISRPFHSNLEETDKTLVHVVANADVVFDGTIRLLRKLRPMEGALLSVNSGPGMETCYSTETNADINTYHRNAYKLNRTLCIPGEDAHRTLVRQLYRESVNESTCSVMESNGGYQWCRYPEATSWDAIAFTAQRGVPNWTPLYDWTSNHSLFVVAPTYMNQDAAEFKARCGLEHMGYKFYSTCSNIVVAHWHCGSKMHKGGNSAVQRDHALYPEFLKCRAIRVEEQIPGTNATINHFMTPGAPVMPH